MPSLSPPIRQRTLCFRCLRPNITCFCQQLRPVTTELELVLLQHPAERRRTIGTARMAHLCITNSRLIVGHEFQTHQKVNELIEDPVNACVTLYPGPESLDIGIPGRWVTPTQKRLVIFVIDGTWLTASSMLKKSPNVRALPQIRFNPKHESGYRFRVQPEPHCLSTVEAVHTLLEYLEPKVNRSNLLEVFHTMVETQLRYAAHDRVRRVEFQSKRSH